MVELRIGPVPSGSVTIWVAYARTVLAQALSTGGGLPPIDPALIEEMERHLDAWEAAATPDQPFLWTTEADPERLAYLAHTFLQIVQRLSEQAENRGFPIAPVDGEEFYQALIRGIIDAFEAEGRSFASFAEQLRDEWPGLKEP
ncbi:MAG: hypothetical protein JJU45_01485 [Acidimicrobiia bacterium]|nr:hypothetical protein [Acidimicrobiia bacterium]